MTTHNRNLARARQMPLRVFARLDSASSPAWWLTAGDGFYTRWPPGEKEINMPRQRVPAGRLVIEAGDPLHDIGDWQAITEVRGARMRHEERQAN